MAVLAFFPFFFPIFFYLIEKNALLSVLSSERRRRRKRERTFSYFPQRAFRTRILLDVAPSSVNGRLASLNSPKFPLVSSHDTIYPPPPPPSSRRNCVTHRSEERNFASIFHRSPDSVPPRLPQRVCTRECTAGSPIHPILDQQGRLVFATIFSPFLPCFNVSSLIGEGRGRSESGRPPRE